MLDRLKKVFIQPDGFPMQPVVADPVSEWAGSRDIAFTDMGESTGFLLEGKIGNKPWKLECSKSTRDYILGDELRARAELKLNDDVAVLIMNRSLKEVLENRAYHMYTDTLHTIADPNLPEEMRWLAMYPEAKWDSLPPKFWERYSVMAERRGQALAWLDPHLGQLLMNWPEPAPGEQVPFILMILRGKAYLRMQYTPADIPTLKHAAEIFTYACESGVSGLTADILV